MANTLNLGNGNWGVKDSSLLGYKNRSNGRFLPETFDVSRGSAGTRVNQSGLIETPEEILSGELITNGSFATDSDWVKQAGWSISGGKAIAVNVPNTQRLQSNNETSVIGKTYKYSFEASNISGFYTVYIYGVNVLALINTEGLVEGTFVATSTNGAFYISGATVNGLATGEFDNVSVVEVNRDNLARIDYLDDAAGVLLTEPQSTNLVTDSNDFSDASWVKQGFGTATAPTVTSNFAISPDGNLNADRVIFDLNGGSTSDDFSQMNWVGSIINGDASASVYIKSNTNESYVMSFTNPTGSAREITVTPNWQRFSTFTLGVSQSPTLRIRLRGGTESTSDYADVSIYGGQLEELSYPTSYIPTNGAIATRLADVVNNAGDVNNFNSEEGVLFAEIAALREVNDNVQYIGLGSGTYTNNSVMIQLRSSANQIGLWVYSNGVNQIGEAITVSDITSNTKIALKWKQNDFAIWVDGIEVFTDVTFDVPTVNSLNTLSFSRDGLQNFYGKTKNVQVFNEALTDIELQTLTTI